MICRRLLGVKAGDDSAEEGGKKKSSKVQKIAKDEVLMVNIGSTRSVQHSPHCLSPCGTLVGPWPWPVTPFGNTLW